LTWKIDLSDGARKDLRSLDPQNQKKILSYLRKRVTQNPRAFGKQLVGNKAGLWRYRVQDFRIVCRIENEKLIILVVAVGHRKEIYDVI
jgi:mRNA interferase RelE/StbE